MQVKTVSNKRTGENSTAGIDVSQEWLDVHVLPGGETLRVANTEAGIRKLKRFLSGLNTDFVVVEPTGRWHRLVQRSLHADGIAVAEVNPYRARSFARAEGILAKNDKLDARVLAMFGVSMNPMARPPQPEIIAELSELTSARTSAVAERTALENQTCAATNPFLKRQLKHRISQLDKAISALEKEILRQIKSEPMLARRYEIFQSIPGVGDVTAFTFIVRLSERGQLTSKAVGKLVGVAPLDWDSGKMKGQRRIFGGRQDIRNVVCMAAHNAVSSNAPLKLFHERLMRSGKTCKQAITAVMRKLVILANTLVAENRLWQLTAPITT